MLYDIGDRPGEGEYHCKRCTDWTVSLRDGQRLPPCGKCGDDLRVSYAEVSELTTAR